jgi:hypothetical protein
MKATEMIKKLGELFGNKATTSAAGQCPGSVETPIQVAPDEKAPVIPWLDRLGVIQLHQYWRN